MTGSHAGSVLGGPPLETSAGTSVLRPRVDRAGEGAEDPGPPPAPGRGPIGPFGRRDWYTSVKAVADYLAAGALLVLALPVMLAAGY
jgi:hypothetical protein